MVHSGMMTDLLSPSTFWLANAEFLSVQQFETSTAGNFGELSRRGGTKSDSEDDEPKVEEICI